MRLSPPERVTAVIRTHRSLFLAGVVVACVCLWTAIGVTAYQLVASLRGLPDHTAVLSAESMPRATTIADARGRHAFTLFEERRLEVPLERISPHLIQAILAIEDRRFYDHRGIDVIRIGGAAVNNLLTLSVSQGGSTITQQLARLTFLTHDRTIRRKVQEIVIAARLEDAFTKDEILELYLNRAYFGDGLYGVEAASLGYFGKQASDLTVAEAALIAGLVKAPSAYAPTAAPERALARRDVVLGAMRDTGLLDEAAYREALQTPLQLEDTLRSQEAFGRYFKEEVRQQLVELFGWERVYQEGLKVETTIDLDMQKAAEAEVARALEEIAQRQPASRRAADQEPLEAALVALDPRTGAVRAMVGGRDFGRSSFNRATQSRRQPGSAFKPFVYAAALERGYTPATQIRGLNEPVMTFRGAWLPEDDHGGADAVTMRVALRASSNRAAVRMLQTIGVDAAVDMAEQFGLGRMPAVPSVALGAGEVTLVSLTSAFGAFANNGVLAAPSLIRRVTTNEGEVLYEAVESGYQAVSAETAFLVSSMLQDVVDAGTAAQARRLGFRLPAAGKTGTTNDYRDAWFVGYTPSLVTGVWVGYDRPRTIVNGGYAAQLAVPLWARFMTTVTRGDAREWLPVPDGIVAVEIDRASGQLATDACRHAGHVGVEYFARGTEPIARCPLHRSGILQALFGAPDNAEPAAPPVAVVAEVPAAAEPPAAVEEAPAAEPEPPKKKRGFWSRVFGLGD